MVLLLIIFLCLFIASVFVYVIVFDSGDLKHTEYEDDKNESSGWYI